MAQKAAQLFPPEQPPRPAFSVSRGLRIPFAPSDTVQLAPSDSGRLIDVMVVWTPAAEDAQPHRRPPSASRPCRTSRKPSVDSANAAYLNSGIAQRLRLVHRQQVTYAERTNCAGGGTAFDCALDDVTDAATDTSNVHGLRNTHGADLVALLIDDGAFCGLAWLPSTPSAEPRFLRHGIDCAVGNKSFAHEVGHNMGAHHDPANASPFGPKPFNKGYISPQLNWRTVMAYPGPCGGCTRLNYFSNPKLTNNGTAMGSAAVSNNAHVLNFTARDIAGYRATSALHPVAQRFNDVPTNHMFYGYIEFFAQAGITTGCSGSLFCPDAAVSRRQMAAFIERAMRASNWTPPTNSTVFTDVAAGSLFAGHIEAMRTDGITSGCTATTYCPDNSVTRDQMAVFILRARCGSGYVPNTPVTPMFADVPLSHPFVALHREAVLARHHRWLRDRTVALLPRSAGDARADGRVRRARLSVHHPVGSLFVVARNRSCRRGRRVAGNAPPRRAYSDFPPARSPCIIALRVTGVRGA